MFDANNNYSPPDVETRHVIVATKAFTDVAPWLKQHQGFAVPVSVAAGQVGRVVMLGHTQVAVAGPALSAETVLIEHATAKVGDILTEAEVTAATKTQEVKLASVKASQEARKAAA